MHEYYILQELNSERYIVKLLKIIFNLYFHVIFQVIQSQKNSLIE